MTDICEDYRVRLEAHVDGELPSDHVPALEAHIAVCECCAAYHAELLGLRDGLGRLMLREDVPDVSEVVLRRLNRRLRMRFALMASAAVVVKLADVWGAFGSGAAPRLIVAAVVLSAFCLIGINPLRFIRPEELVPRRESGKGVNHASL